jgi:hypothetical protein
MKIDCIKKELAELQKSSQLHINFAEGHSIETMSDSDAFRIYELIKGNLIKQ